MMRVVRSTGWLEAIQRVNTVRICTVVIPSKHCHHDPGDVPFFILTRDVRGAEKEAELKALRRSLARGTRIVRAITLT